MMEDAKILVRDSREIFASGLAPRLEQRQVVLKKLESVLIAKQEEILAALATDLGKPGMEAYLSEYYFLLQELRLVRRKMKSWLKKKRVGPPFYFQPCRSWIERKPFGVVLVMAPWNYPFQLSLSPVIAAVAAGNLVVLKPSEMAKESERVIGEIIEEAFDGLVRVVTGGPEVAQSLLEKDFDFIFFTGSTRVGREVAVKAAETLTPALMELGG
ncbi:MAG: aldehyde dehydrogenase family protein, partial [Akkermansiaceae bacterium]|nr:aldehyde dehydrogenase family protein [Akkermansiaceae bacterium]